MKGLVKFLIILLEVVIIVSGVFSSISIYRFFKSNNTVVGTSTSCDDLYFSAENSYQHALLTNSVGNILNDNFGSILNDNGSVNSCYYSRTRETSFANDSGDIFTNSYECSYFGFENSKHLYDFCKQNLLNLHKKYDLDSASHYMVFYMPEKYAGFNLSINDCLFGRANTTSSLWYCKMDNYFLSHFTTYSNNNFPREVTNDTFTLKLTKDNFVLEINTSYNIYFFNSNDILSRISATNEDLVFMILPTFVNYI